MEREINILRDLGTMLCKEEWKNYLIQKIYLIWKSENIFREKDCFLQMFKKLQHGSENKLILCSHQRVELWSIGWSCQGQISFHPNNTRGSCMGKWSPCYLEWPIQEVLFLQELRWVYSRSLTSENEWFYICRSKKWFHLSYGFWGMEGKQQGHTVLMDGASLTTACRGC